MHIHPTAIVSPKAEIDSNVFVGPYAIIGDEVRLHSGVQIGSHSVIEGPTEIGEDTQVFPHVCLGQRPQDLKFKGEVTRLIIGKRNVFREFSTAHRGTAGGGGVTTIGDDNLFMAQSHVAHDCHVGNSTIFANGASLAGHVIVEDYAILGAYCGVHQFCRIGKYSFLGAFSVVVKDVLPYSKCAGDHAKCYGPNTLGLRRRELSEDAISKISRAFKLLLTSKLNTSQALERMKIELADVPEVAYMIDFIEKSERGVVK